jgi:hypothetical protein
MAGYSGRSVFTVGNKWAPKVFILQKYEKSTIRNSVMLQHFNDIRQDTCNRCNCVIKSNNKRTELNNAFESDYQICVKTAMKRHVSPFLGEIKLKQGL